MNKEYKRKLKNIIGYFGETNQIRKTIEELTELSLALQTGTTNEVLEEMADVSIMLDQLTIMFGDIKAFKDSKLIRTQIRMENGYYEKA